MMKKYALKGLTSLGVIVLLCFFFSGTLHTLTTAKVRMTRARTGRLETTLSLSGNLYWQETEPVRAEDLTAADLLTVISVQVAVGSYVLEGETLLTCQLTDYESRMETLQSSYEAKKQEYLELERKNSNLLIMDRQREWFSAWQRWKEAWSAAEQARQDLHLAAWKAGTVLHEDGEVPDGVEDESFLAAAEAFKAAEKERNDAESAFLRYNRQSVNEEVISYLEKEQELKLSMESLSGQMLNLRKLKTEYVSIRAPHEGYVTSMELKEGDSISQITRIAEMTPEGIMPVIRLIMPDSSDGSRNVTTGINVELTAGGKTIMRNTTGIVVGTSGGVFVEVPLLLGDLLTLGGAANLLESGSVTGKIILQSENNTTLIPAAALRGAEGDYYVYLVSQDIGQEKMIVTRKNVTVLGKSPSIVSISETLSNVLVVYMEDRTIGEGIEVMLYSEQ